MSNIIISVLAWLFLIAFGSAQNTKFQFNLDFEYSLSSVENSWVPLLDDFKWTRDTVEKVQGKSSFKFTRTYLKREFQLCLFQKIVLPQPGNELEVSLYSKSDQLNSAWFKIIAFDKNMIKIAVDSISLANNNQWQKFISCIKDTDDIYAISIEVRAKESFSTKKKLVTFWIDDMSIEIEGNALSKMIANQFVFKKKEISEINNNYPLNPDLEIPLKQITTINNKKIVGFGETVHGSKEINQAIFNNIKLYFNWSIVLRNSKPYFTCPSVV